MAQFKTFYVPSTTEGKHYQIYCGKRPGSPGYVSATEGTLEQQEGYQSFSYMMFQTNRLSEDVQGPMVKKNIQAALGKLRSRLLSEGFIAAETSEQGTA